MEFYRVRNPLAAAAHRSNLQSFANAIENHNRRGLGIVAEYQRADGSNAHEHVFVKKATFYEARHRADEHFISRKQVGRYAKGDLYPAVNKHTANQQRNRNSNRNKLRRLRALMFMFLFLFMIASLRMRAALASFAIPLHNLARNGACGAL
ncbi:hypothetical protein SDC9_81357 [bioreactor metagenome]|uniref:Uncharacterized protein n=1 Tax=bioreactor metagenome TaxID=1076179 RepID=A0A644Z1K3_9ZZZZ